MLIKCPECGKETSNVLPECKYCGCWIQEDDEYDMPEFAIEGSTLLLYNGDKTNVTIPNGISRIENKAFSTSWGLQSLTMPDSVIEIGDEIFPMFALSTIKLSNNLISIGKNAFACTALTEINIPESVKTIEAAAFQSTALHSVKLPEGLKILSSALFMGCKQLSSVLIPNTVTEIEPFAFTDCSSLKSIFIPLSVTKIWKNAFEDCSALLTIYAEATSQPTGWEKSWNPSNCKVIWNYRR